MQGNAPPRKISVATTEQAGLALSDLCVKSTGTGVADSPRLARNAGKFMKTPQFARQTLNQAT